MITLYILLKVSCYIVLQKVVQACDSSLLPSKVLATMDLADTLDDVNNNISYAILDGNRAFCVDSRNGFFMQIEFASVRKVTKLRTEGFNLNGTYYSLHAYKLQFSFDNITWYMYNDGNTNSPQFFLVQPKSFTSKGTIGNIVDHKLNGIGKFVRIVPHWSRNMNKQPFCIKFHVKGCERVSPPLVIVGPTEQAKINQPTVLTCNASGAVGLVVAWRTFSSTQNKQKDGVYLNGYTVTSNLTLDIQFKDLDSYTCEQTSSQATCSRKFTCKSFYYFNKKTKTEMNKFVKVIIEFPKPVQNLFTSNKTESEIQLNWNMPSRNDVPAEMLRYRLACNLTSRLIEEYLSFTDISRTLSNLEVYALCKCNLVLVVANDTEDFPFSINHDPVELYFRSRSLRPNVTPIITASAISPYSIKVTFMTEIKVYNEGVLQGHKIDVTMMKYGNRILQENLFSKRHFIQNVTNPKQNEVVLDGLKPWAYYNVSVVAFNQDGLYSNHSFKHIATPEGTPDIGPSLTLVTRTSKSISVQIDLNAFPFFKHNGKIIMYKILVLPDKREENFQRLQFEVMGLLPNTEYMFQCKVSTSFGYGPYGALLKAKTAEGKPSEPRNVYVEQSNSRHMLYVTWTKPLHPNGKITQYEIQYIRKDGKPKSVMKAPDQTSRIELIDNDGEIDSVMVRAFTKEGDGEWSKHVQVNPRTRHQNSLRNSINLQLIIILFVSLAVSLSAVGSGCYCYFRRPCRSSNRKRQQKLVHDFVEEPLCSPKYSSSLYSPLQSLKKNIYTSSIRGNIDGETAMLEEEKAWISTNGYDQSGFETEHKPILKEEFLDYVNSVKKYDHEILANQFKKIPSGKQYSWGIAEKLDNQLKNRYREVYPYDHSRVILHFDCKRKTADYINASLIHGFNHLHDSNIYYISTQGPMPNTYNDFWHMIWQESITVIVMVTNLKENEMEKCNQYWPNNGHIKYGGIIVALDKIDKTADYITRTFQVEKVNTKEVRSIRQFQFVSWPDHGVPDYPTALLSLRRRMHHYWKEGRPILVHCSAGIGRSGCFILIDAMLEQIDQQGTVDVYSYFKYLRTRRINMVQNVEQYIFAHNAILEYITFGNTEILVDELDRKTRELSRGTGMTKEFALLSRNTDQSDSSNTYKVLLLQGKHMDAFHVDGYKQRDAFILTKAPDEKNVADFWKMVLERQCHTIVMLNKLQEPSQEYLRYWPDVEGHASYCDVAVLMSSEVANGNIITRKIKVTTSKSRCEVHHFQYVDWPDADVPNRRAYSNICTLTQAVEKSQQTLGNGPIIVHAGNDFGRSGTFIAIYNSTERLKVEQIIDVLQCVRAIRIAQPLAVDNVAQYQFVYNMLRTYLEGFENYYNYIDYKTCRSPFCSTSTM